MHLPELNYCAHPSAASRFNEICAIGVMILYLRMMRGGKGKESDRHRCSILQVDASAKAEH